MRKEFAVLDHQLDAGNVHVNDAPGADVQMTDFAVAHLPVGQADKGAAGVDQRVGIFAQQAIVGRLARKRDRVGLVSARYPQPSRMMRTSGFGRGISSNLSWR